MQGIYEELSASVNDGVLAMALIKAAQNIPVLGPDG